MIKGYQDFYYNVSDMNRAIQFYEAGLGMKIIYGDDYWTSMTLGNLRLGLHWTETEVPITPRDSHGQSCGGTLTFLSDNIPQDRDNILKAGGNILGESDHPWGYILVFEDLDGNVLKLMNPK